MSQDTPIIDPNTEPITDIVEQPISTQSAENPSTESTPNTDEQQSQTSASPTVWDKIKSLLTRFFNLFKQGDSSLLRYILRLAFFAVIILGLFWVIDRITPKSDIFGFLKPEPLTIEKTQNLVVNIRDIAELHSASFCGEYLVKNSKSKTANADKKDSIYIIIKSRINAGFDLSKIQKDDIVIDHDTLNVTIPPVKILDVITNPSDIEIFAETGSWSDSQIQQTICMGRKDIQQIAINHGILPKAQESGIQILQNIFQSFGYAKVNITLAKEK